MARKELLKDFHQMGYGGDYNPDQWLDRPDILAEDIRLMKKAHVNLVSVGIFAWSALEKEEGVYTFEWLDSIMDNLYKNGIFVILATPSGARPHWLSEKYPEVLRVEANGVRIQHIARHNHCYTSPIYREKVQNINARLANRYQDHPALVAWHVSNEYCGECHCELCQKEFRVFLQEKYKNLDNLNHAWWSSFWSNTFTSWDQIRSGNNAIHGLALDWKRFVTKQTVSFFQAEIEPLKKITPNIPVTINMMRTFPGLDYMKFKDCIDFASWDNYPQWHTGNDVRTASETALCHDQIRMIKDQPFLMMESTPSLVNWQRYSHIKKPGMNILSSLQAIAHGSDSVMYFQWRKSRGSAEKLHGAVVDHEGSENTRVFKEATTIGKDLIALQKIVGTRTKSQVAIIFDQENRWAFDGAQGFSNEDKGYRETVVNHYYSLWRNGVNIDVIDETCDFSRYSVLSAPLLYLIKPGVSKRIEEFVAQGGTFVATYGLGYVDQNDLCALGGFPLGELRKVTGIWDEEIDTLTQEQHNSALATNDFIKEVSKQGISLNNDYTIKRYCSLIHRESEKCKALMNYGSDFYKGRPCLTVNEYKKGKCYYIAAEIEQDFLDILYHTIITES